MSNIISLALNSAGGRQVDTARVEKVGKMLVSTVTVANGNRNIATPDGEGQPFLIKASARQTYVRAAQLASAKDAKNPVYLRFFEGPALVDEKTSKETAQLYVVRVADAPKRANSVWTAPVTAEAAAPAVAPEVTDGISTPEVAPEAPAAPATAPEEIV